MSASQTIMRKRSISCLIEENDNDERCEPVSFSPNKKIKIDELAIVRKMFTDNDDFTKFNNIYQALLSMKSRILYPHPILIQISIFATGNIKICDHCDQTEILCLNKFDDKYLQNSRSGYYEDSARSFGWASGTSKYFYCKKCVDNGLLLKCQGPCSLYTDGFYSRKHLNLAYGHKFDGDEIFVCNECIEETCVLFSCDKCNMWVYDAPAVDDRSVDHCGICDESICPCTSYYYCDTEQEFVCGECKKKHKKKCKCKLQKHTNVEYYYPAKNVEFEY